MVALEEIFSRAHVFIDNVNQIDMVECHIDDYDTISMLNNFGGYLTDSDEFKLYGGCKSVRCPPHESLHIIFGQDESIFRENQLNTCCWSCEGQMPERPKNLGKGMMVSAFQSRPFGFSFNIDAQELSLVNDYRLGKSYADEGAATEYYGSSSKPVLMESPFSRVFEYGKGRDGYWGYNQMVIQMEDCIDCLVVLFPHPTMPNRTKFIPVFEYDHSSGHSSVRPDGLNVHSMSAGYGGVQPKMHDTVILAKEGYLGDHVEGRVAVGTIQSMVFRECDPPPVYAPDAPMFDVVDPKVFSLKKTNKSELIEELRLRNINAERKYEDLRDRAAAAGIDTMKMVYKTILGYVGAAKGLKQVAWERGYVTRQMLQDDVVTLDGYWKDQDGNKCRKDKDGAYFDENTSLRFIIGKCKDFQ